MQGSDPQMALFRIWGRGSHECLVECGKRGPQTLPGPTRNPKVAEGLSNSRCREVCTLRPGTHSRRMTIEVAPAGKAHRIVQARLFRLLKESEPRRGEAARSSALAEGGSNLSAADTLKRGGVTGRPGRRPRIFIRLLGSVPFAMWTRGGIRWGVCVQPSPPQSRESVNLLPSVPCDPHPRICLIPVSALISLSAQEEGYLTISSLPPKTDSRALTKHRYKGAGDKGDYFLLFSSFAQRCRKGLPSPRASVTGTFRFKLSSDPHTVYVKGEEQKASALLCR